MPTISKTRRQARGLMKIWQPADLLPDFRNPRKAFEDIRDILWQALDLPAEVLYVTAANKLTEEGLPNFATRLMTIKDLPAGEDGDADSHPGVIQRWFREWIGEENRHGVALNDYLNYTGHVDMQALQRSEQMFLEDGFKVTDNGLYHGIVYTSFQERATQVSHMNVAKLAGKYGNTWLAKILGQIAADEGYHGNAYSDFVKIFFKTDPDGAMQAVADMLDHGITMPAHNMAELRDRGEVVRTFDMFAQVAQRIGVYTAKDYANISAELIKLWGIAEVNAGKWQALPVEGLGEQGRDAQNSIIKRQRVTERIAAARKDVSRALDTTWLVQPERK